MKPTPPYPSPDSAPAADSGDFRIQAPLEILNLMRRLEAERRPLSLSSPGGPNETSLICEIDAGSGRLLLNLPSSKPPLQTLMAAEEVTAVAYLDQIRLQFDVEGLMLVHGDKSAARGEDALLQISLPQLLYRFQRRQSFRVRPASRTPQAHFLSPAPHAQALSLRVLDLSLGGLALLVQAGQEAPATGSLLSDVRVELDRHTRLQVDLRVQQLRPQADGSCQLGLSFENLAPLAERDLQHYIDHAQKMARLLRNKVTP